MKMLKTRHVLQLTSHFSISLMLRRHFVSVCSGEGTRIETAMDITRSVLAGYPDL